MFNDEVVGPLGIPVVDDLTMLWDRTCTVCMQYFHPPIRRCVLGHSVCNSCSFRAKHCPRCYSTFAKCQRVNVMESIHYLFNYTCKYPGCDVTVEGSKIVDHENKCYHAIKGCPLREVSHCTWNGLRSQILQHCLELHRSNIFVSNNQKLVLTDLLQQTGQVVTRYYVLLYVCERFFKCILEIDFDKRAMKWCVFIMDDFKLDHFDFQIELMNPHGNSMYIQGACPPFWQDESIKIDDEHFIYVSLDVIKKQNPDNCFKFTVGVTQRENIFV